MVMKFQRILSFVIALGVGLTLTPGCSKPSEEDENYNSSFSLKKSVLNVGSEGGRLVCEYSISGPKEGVTATATPAEDWIAVSAVYSTEFTITVAENATGKDRTGEVQLSCSGVKPAKVRIIQSAKRSEQQIYSNYKITVSNITTSTCRIEVEPVDASKTYIYGVARKSDFDSMTAKEYIEARISQIEQMASSYAQSPTAFLSSGSVDTDKLSADTKPSVYDRTEYYVTAFDLAYNESTKKYSYSGNIDKVAFTSASAPASNMTFTIKQSGELLTITPSNSSDTYVYDYMSKSSWDEFKTKDDAAHLYVYYASAYNQLTLSRGTKVINLAADDTVTKGETYVVYAVGYLSDETRGGLTTEVASYEFKY